ncbi:MAG TPA: GTP cyclohydrolase I FolE [Planctomycetota bacterium]|nr:GTP cyclohydrolase I FolE [Planctomycetota bacterium]
MTVDRKKVEEAVRLLIEGIGDDPARPGLQDTPRRVARMYEEIFEGIGVSGERVVGVLESEQHDEIVLIRDIPFYSMCEHHLLPFIGKAHMAYIPGGKRITGLSKLARLVSMHARRLQVQERLTTDIAEDMVRALQPRGVIVVIEAEHLCMTMRGVKAPGSTTVTSVVRGLFRERAATRAEALSLIYGPRSR